MKARVLSFTRPGAKPGDAPRIGVKFWSDHEDELTINTFDHTIGTSPCHAFDLSFAEEECLYLLLRKRRKVRERGMQ